MPFHDDLGPASQIDTVITPLDVLRATGRDNVNRSSRATVYRCGDC